MPEAIVERDGHVLTVTMNRPEARNALSGEMMQIMSEAWDEVNSNPDIRVAILTGAGGHFCAGADLKAMTQSHPGDAGLSSGDGSGFDVLHQLAKKYSGIRVIVLTVHEAGEYAIRALREGAVGFLPKSAASTELENAIQSVMRGEVYISPETSRKTLLEYDKGRKKRDQLANLSPRQREVLRLIAEGRTTKQIAQMLEISVKTVETHRAQLMDRLGIHDVAGLVRYAIIVGLVDVE